MPPALVYFKGKITAAANTTITDTNSNFLVNQFVGWSVVMSCTNATGLANYVPQFAVIVSNTSTVITVASAWTKNPLPGDDYFILPPFTSSGSVAPPADVDQLLQSNTTISIFPYTSAQQSIGRCKHVDVQFIFAAFSGGTAPTVQAKLQVVEPTSNTVVKTFAGVQLSSAGNDTITVDGGQLGDTVQVTIVATGAPTNISGVYVRLVAK